MSKTEFASLLSQLINDFKIWNRATNPSRFPEYAETFELFGKWIAAGCPAPKF